MQETNNLYYVKKNDRFRGQKKIGGVLKYTGEYHCFDKASEENYKLQHDFFNYIKEDKYEVMRHNRETCNDYFKIRSRNNKKNKKEK